MLHVFQPYPIEELDFNPFKSFKEDGAVLVANDADNNRVNATSVNNGSVGVMFGRNTATIYLPVTKYTTELLEKDDYVTINFFDMTKKGIKSTMKFLDKATGRNEDKISAVGMHVNIDPDYDVPFLDEANFVILCRIVAKSELSENSLLHSNKKIIEKFEGHDQVLFLTEIIKSFAR